jgi:hypothetical protein
VSYINDIPLLKTDHPLADTMKLLSLWSGTSTEGFLPPAQTLGCSGTFPMPLERSRLHFKVQHALRSIDNAEVLQLSLTARGLPSDAGDAAILRWFDSGREWIVRGFADLTTSEAHKHWRRTK